MLRRYIACFRADNLGVSRAAQLGKYCPGFLLTMMNELTMIIVTKLGYNLGFVTAPMFLKFATHLEIN